MHALINVSWRAFGGFVMFVRFQFASTVFAEMVRDQLARSDVGCIPPTSGGFVVERIEFPAAGAMPMDVDRSGEFVIDSDVGSMGLVMMRTAAAVDPSRRRFAPAPDVRRRRRRRPRHRRGGS